MEMPDTKFIIAVVGKKLFPARMHIDSIVGEFLYEQLILALEGWGEEITPRNAHTRLGVYLDSRNDDSRYFEFDWEVGEKIDRAFGHSYYKAFAEYSKRERVKGTDLLHQLASGELSTSDFDDKLQK